MKRLIWGTNPVTEALRSTRKSDAHTLYVAQEVEQKHKALTKSAKDAGLFIEWSNQATLDRLTDGGKHQGLLIVAGEYSYASADELIEAEKPFLILVDSVTDPRNFGAIVRSAVAFGATGILIPKNRACPVTPVVVRASAGATEHAKIARVTNLARTIEQLNDRFIPTVGLAGEAEVSLSQLNLDGEVALVVGSEGSGLRHLVRKRCSVLAKIPMTSGIESLNASVAASVAMYELTR